MSRASRESGPRGEDVPPTESQRHLPDSNGARDITRDGVILANKPALEFALHLRVGRAVHSTTNGLPHEPETRLVQLNRDGHFPAHFFALVHFSIVREFVPNGDPEAIVPRAWFMRASSRRPQYSVNSPAVHVTKPMPNQRPVRPKSAVARV